MKSCLIAITGHVDNQMETTSHSMCLVSSFCSFALTFSCSSVFSSFLIQILDSAAVDVSSDTCWLFVLSSELNKAVVAQGSDAVCSLCAAVFFAWTSSNTVIS